MNLFAKLNGRLKTQSLVEAGFKYYAVLKGLSSLKNANKFLTLELITNDVKSAGGGI